MFQEEGTVVASDSGEGCFRKKEQQWQRLRGKHKHSIPKKQSHLGRSMAERDDAGGMGGARG